MSGMLLTRASLYTMETQFYWLSSSIGMRSFQEELNTNGVSVIQHLNRFQMHFGAEKQAHCIRSKISNILIWAVLLVSTELLALFLHFL